MATMMLGDSALESLPNIKCERTLNYESYLQ
jgi:hypothetical protein